MRQKSARVGAKKSAEGSTHGQIKVQGKTFVQSRNEPSTKVLNNADLCFDRSFSLETPPLLRREAFFGRTLH